MQNDLILGYSDQHLRELGSFIPFNQISHNGLSKELNNMIAGWQFVGEMIRKYKPKLAYNFGDIVHCTEGQSAQVIHGMYLAHEVVAKACVDVGTIHLGHVGNHDVLNEQLGINNVNILSRYYNHPLYLEPMLYQGLKDFRIGIIPYSSNVAKTYQCLAEYQFECDVLFGHLDIQGCRYESGQTSESEVRYEFETPLISGDIHYPQSFNSIHYVGSLVQHRFNLPDLTSAGGVLLMDMHTKEVFRVRNNLSKHYIKVRDNNLEDALQLDPSQCVFQVVSFKPKDEIDHLFQGREYHYTPEVKPVSQMKKHYIEFSIQDPQEVLRSWVTRDRPDALGEFDHIFGEMK